LSSFEQLLEALANAKLGNTKKYDWDKVYEYLANHEFATASVLRKVVGVPSSQQCYQWLQRNTGLVIDLTNLDDPRKYEIDAEKELTKIKTRAGVVYSLRSTVESILEKASKKKAK